MVVLKVRKFGNSMGVIIPKEALARLKVEGGDALFLTEAPDGFRITPYDPRFEEQMAHAHTIMKRRRAALRQLAK